MSLKGFHLFWQSVFPDRLWNELLVLTTVVSTKDVQYLGNLLHLSSFEETMPSLIFFSGVKGGITLLPNNSKDEAAFFFLINCTLASITADTLLPFQLCVHSGVLSKLRLLGTNNN